MGLQHQIASLTEKLKEIQPMWSTRPNVWCTHCLMEGHVVTECPWLRGQNVGTSGIGAQGAPPLGGFVQIKTQGLYPPQHQYTGFPTQQSPTTNEYCEICKNMGHQPHLCPI